MDDLLRTEDIEQCTIQAAKPFTIAGPAEPNMNHVEASSISKDFERAIDELYKTSQIPDSPIAHLSSIDANGSKDSEEKDAGTRSKSVIPKIHTTTVQRNTVVTTVHKLLGITLIQNHHYGQLEVVDVHSEKSKQMEWRSRYKIVTLQKSDPVLSDHSTRGSDSQ